MPLTPPAIVEATQPNNTPGFSQSNTNPDTVSYVYAQSNYAAVNAVVPETLAHHLATNAAGHAQGLTGSYDDKYEVTGWRYAEYSATNMFKLTNAVWSTNFWLHGVRGLSATPVGLLTNNPGGQTLFTMVSPRHYLFSTHTWPNSHVAVFLDTNNVFYWRTSLGRVDVGLDTSVGFLNEDLPESVGFLPIAPTNFWHYLPANDFVEGIGMNQDMRLFAQPMLFNGSGYVSWNSTKAIPFGLGTDWNFNIRGGDSSNPEMLLISNQLVLVSHNWFANGGPDFSTQIDSINKAMHYLSTNYHATTDYQLTPYSLTNFPVLH